MPLRDLVFASCKIPFEPRSWIPVSGYGMSIVKWSLRHVCGVVGVRVLQDDAVVLCVVRDGSEHIGKFIEHHRDMGVKHIVFPDNGSRDVMGASRNHGYSLDLILGGAASRLLISGSTTCRLGNPGADRKKWWIGRAANLA